MNRKLVKHGEATMMISLPSKWIHQNKLNKGDELEVEERGNHLLIKLEKEKEIRETELNLSSLDEAYIRTLITNAYRLGFDKIHIKFEKKETLKTIKEVVEKNLLGFDIIKEGEKFCEIESITEPSKEQFDNIFNKFLMNIEEMFEAVKSQLNGLEAEYKDTDRRILQYDNFCKRILVKYNKNEENFLKWAVHSNLTHASRELYHLAEYLAKNKCKSSKEELLLLEKVRQIFQGIKSVYDSGDFKGLEKVNDLEKEIVYKIGYSLLKKSKDPVIVFRLLSSARQFYLAFSPLAGAIINKPNYFKLHNPLK